MNIRELKDEIVQVTEILKTPSDGLTWFSPWTEQQISEEIDRAWNRGYFDGTSLAAFIFAREHDEGVEITNLGTHQNYRRQGLMKLLIKELFKMRPRSRIWLEVHEGNNPAIKLYESLEFREVGRRKRYYNDGSGCIVMKREPQATSS